MLDTVVAACDSCAAQRSAWLLSAAERSSGLRSPHRGLSVEWPAWSLTDAEMIKQISGNL